MTIEELIVYLRGRKVYLRAQAKIWESGSYKERTAQARLSEISDLLFLLDDESREGP